VERNGYQQSVAGGKDRLPDDQGGHLIASIFNGPGGAIQYKLNQSIQDLLFIEKITELRKM
jgi:hypothetical protein